ncbi:MAG: Wzz/FepE/Etk N-terminal domain-containing protein, partial [Acidimicrobiales bacterium]
MTVEDPGYVPIDEPLDDGSTSRTPGRPVEQFVAIRTVMGALRRRRRLWVITAIIGLVLGLAVTVVITPKYTATSSLLLFHNPADDQTLDMANDAAIADTATVAQDVVNRLRLSLTANQLLSDCQVVVVSDALLQVSVSAATPSAALLRTSTLAAVF